MAKIMVGSSNRSGSYKLIYLFVILLAFQFTLFAQAPEAIVYKKKDGILSNLYTFHLLQSSKGFIWGCTNAGVFRYDGTEFKRYSIEEGLKDYATLRAMEDADGKIWVLSYSGDLAYTEGDRFHQYPVSEEARLFLSQDRTINFQIDRQKNLYIGTQVNGLFKIDSSGELTNITPDIDHKSGLGVWISDDLPPIPFGVIDKESMYFGDTLRIYDHHFKCVQELPYQFKGRTMEYRPIFYKCHDGSIALTFGKYLFKISKEMKVTETYVGSHLFNSVCEDRIGNLWFATHGNGILKFPKGNLKKPPIVRFAPHSVNWIMEDQEGGIWASVFTEGVWHFPAPSVLKWNKENSNLPFTTIYDIIVTDSSWFYTTAENKVYRYDGRSHIDMDWKRNLGTANKVDITELFLDSSNGRLYVPYDYDIAYWDGSSQFKKMNIPMESRDLIRGKFKRFIKNEDGSLWIFGYLGGIKVKDDSVIQITEKCNDGRINYATKTPDGQIFVGGAKGVYILDDNTLKLMKDIHPMLEGRINGLCYHKGGLWIAHSTLGVGIYRGDSIYLVGGRDKFKGTANIQVEEDTIWANTSRHIYKMIQVSEDSIHIEKHLIGFDIGTTFIEYYFHNDQLYLPSNNGLTILNRNEINKKRKKPVVRITSLKIHDRDTALLATYQLDYTQDFVQIGFTGISFRSGSISYRYRMTGVDNVWKHSEQRSIQYTKLPPGNYQFEVYAMSSEGLESTVPATIKFSISPPFWATVWFRLLVILIIVSSILLAVRWRIQRLNAKREIEKQLHRLESKALRSQMNPHFIFNVLGAIQGYVSERDTDSSEIYLAKFAKLIRLILENSRKSYISLEQELETLRLYIDMEKMRFVDGFDYHIDITPEIEPELFELPPMLIQPYVENAIVHGLNNKEGKGNIILKFKIDHHLLHCEITDDGIGLKKSNQLKPAGKKHDSLGMLITGERLQLLNDKSAEHLKVNVEDRKDQSGTRVMLKIPIRENRLGNY